MNKYVFILLFLTNCTTVCKSDFLCEKEIDVNHPLFSVVRTVITNGMNGGK